MCSFKTRRETHPSRIRTNLPPIYYQLSLFLPTIIATEIRNNWHKVTRIRSQTLKMNGPPLRIEIKLWIYRIARANTRHPTHACTNSKITTLFVLLPTDYRPNTFTFLPTRRNQRSRVILQETIRPNYGKVDNQTTGCWYSENSCWVWTFWAFLSQQLQTFFRVSHNTPSTGFSGSKQDDLTISNTSKCGQNTTMCWNFFGAPQKEVETTNNIS